MILLIYISVIWMVLWNTCNIQRTKGRDSFHLQGVSLHEVIRVYVRLEAPLCDHINESYWAVLSLVMFGFFFNILPKKVIIFKLEHSWEWENEMDNMELMSYPDAVVYVLTCFCGICCRFEGWRHAVYRVHVPSLKFDFLLFKGRNCCNN